MSHGNIQLAPQHPRGNRVVTISRPQHSDGQHDADDPLFVNVIRRRWMLLTFCLLLSAAAALLVISKFSLPKATSFGQLRYVSLPPSLKDIYQPPGMLEFTEVLVSNQILAKLSHNTGQPIGPKELRKRITLEASRFSNIIDIEVRWRDGKQAIDMTNELMRIACETIAANRKQTLADFAEDTKLRYAEADQDVDTCYERWFRVTADVGAQHSTEGLAGTSTEALIGNIQQTRRDLQTIAVDKMVAEQKLSSLNDQMEKLLKDIRDHQIHDRENQIKTRKQAFPATSKKYQQLISVEKELAEFKRNDSGLDFESWNRKFAAICDSTLGPLGDGSVAAIEVMKRNFLDLKSEVDEIDFDMMSKSINSGILTNNLEAMERQYHDAAGTSDMTTIRLDEAQVALEEAKEKRQRFRQELDAIKHGQETEYVEMKILTEASWQTTEASQGKAKLFVFTFAGCFIVLVIPVFALEHFYPSGDPADNAAKSLGIPRVSRGTFVAHQLNRDRSRLHAINSEAMRLLALRIQQSVHGPGSMVLFSGLNHEKSSIPMISYLAECLARREEHVLIIDACDRPQDSRSRSFNDDSVNAVMSSVQGGSQTAATEEVAPTVPSDDDLSDLVTSDETLPVNVREPVEPGEYGLADFLHRRDIRPEEMICATSIPGVDIISSGTTNFPREGLASSSLTTLFDECRQRYTMILVAGPSTDHPSDLQMLSARADGILFTVPPNGRPAGPGEEVVQDLLDMGAPVIGIVS